MKTTLRTLLSLILIAHAALSADLGGLSRLYARDDQRLAAALRYERVQGGVREQAWVTELGDVLKVSRENADTLDEISLSDDGDVYFCFHKTTTHPSTGGSLVAEERTFFAPYTMLQKTRRTASFAAGAETVIPPKAPSEKLDIAKLSEDERRAAPQFRMAEEILKEVRIPAHLVHDPAKDAPAEWQRVKVVRKSGSADGRYALAFAPDKADFKWEDYAGPEGIIGYWADGDAVGNFIVDIKNHRVLGKTLGSHIGTRERYNHRENTMAWSPDGSTFIQLTSGKWSYETCCIGHITDGKLDTVQDLGPAVAERTKKFLIAEKNADFRRQGKSMEIAIYSPVVKNDGSGTVDVVFQVPKQIDIQPIRVRFRLPTAKNLPRVEILAAAYAPVER